MTWPNAECPAWFIESFANHVGIAHALNWDKPQPDYTEAAKRFWLEVMRHNEFPSPDNPSLTGHTGWRDVCPKGHGMRVLPGSRLNDSSGANGGLWYCALCEQVFTRMDDAFVSVAV